MSYKWESYRHVCGYAAAEITEGSVRLGTSETPFRRAAVDGPPGLAQDNMGAHFLVGDSQRMSCNSRLVVLKGNTDPTRFGLRHKAGRSPGVVTLCGLFF
jgi:hypothetical protein